MIDFRAFMAQTVDNAMKKEKKSAVFSVIAVPQNRRFRTGSHEGSSHAAPPRIPLPAPLQKDSTPLPFAQRARCVRWGGAALPPGVSKRDGFRVTPCPLAGTGRLPNPVDPVYPCECPLRGSTLRVRRKRLRLELREVPRPDRGADAGHQVQEVVQVVPGGEP